MAAAIVTGANGAIGKGIARGLARANLEVVLACRDETKAQAAAEDLKSETGNRFIRTEQVDVSRRESVYDLARRWRGSLEVLVNNAAATPRSRTETPEGIETQFATNVLGYLWTIRAFESALTAAASARVVNVASYWAGDLDVADLQFRRRTYDNDQAYRQSKQANRMLTVVDAERLAQARVQVNSCHPGDVVSKLSSDLGFGGHQTPDEGAATPVWLATADVTESGKYFANEQRAECQFASDRGAITELLGACEPFL